MHNQSRHGAAAVPDKPRRGGTLGMPTKPKPWSHQDELLSMRGKKVVVIYNDGQKVQTTLLEADPFAIKIRVSPEAPVLIVWKHDLSSIAHMPGAD